MLLRGVNAGIDLNEDDAMIYDSCVRQVMNEHTTLSIRCISDEQW